MKTKLILTALDIFKGVAILSFGLLIVLFLVQGDSDGSCFDAVILSLTSYVVALLAGKLGGI